MNEIKQAKIELLKKAGRELYPARTARANSCLQIKNSLDALGPTERRPETVVVAGRVMQIRLMGKSCFINIEDSTAKLQAYFKADELGADYQLFVDAIEAGDFIEVKGFPFKTKTGEPSVHAQSWTLLSKSLLPLPEKWHGLKDTETRYRQRYLDLVSNAQVREIFQARSRIVAAIREVLDSHGYLEVETPIFQAQPGGATAKPFKTFHEALGADLYLRIATELHLKRLIVGGLGKVYEIGKCFRNEGIDTTHNPEFSMLEAYEAYGDYNTIAALTEEIVRRAAGKSGKFSGEVIFEKRKFPELWQKATGEELERFLGDPYHFDRAKLEACAKKLNVAYDHKGPTHKIFDKIMDQMILTQLPGFVFIFDYPTAISPLAKQVPGKPEWAERFELFYNGAELANAFSELNDPQEQRHRMETQLESKSKEKDEEIPPLDEDYIEALAYGLPPTGGLGIGIDRLCMTLLGIDSIREVILFPTLKPREGSGVRGQGSEEESEK
ncbi:MAG: lysine--tRNA ligase [Elusimicrobia bacterium]|nr:lysine--tRNA ligase [Elusimicrobiota bacterium]